MREFKDDNGVIWHVWKTVPSSSKSVASSLKDGWLCFDNGSERRRLGPIPAGWEQMTDEKFRLALRVASPTRITPPEGTPRPTLPDDRG